MVENRIECDLFDGDLDKLTPRENDVLDLIAEGKKNKQIGKALSISDNTVRAHVRTMMQKLGKQNRTELALFKNCCNRREASMTNDPDKGTPGNDPIQRGVNAGVESAIVFSIGTDIFQLLMDRSQQWHAVKWDIDDDRIRRLAQGRTWAVNYTRLEAQIERWIPEIDHVVFQNEQTGEYLSLAFKAIEFVPWAAGWAFLLLGDRVDVDDAQGPEALPW